MLVLTQMAVGLSVTAGALTFWDQTGFKTIIGPASFAICALLVAGLAASILHLRRPLGAWRAWLGLRTSSSLLTAGLITFLLLAVWELAGSLYALHRKQHPLRVSSKIIWFRLPHLAYLRVTSAALAAALSILINRLPAGFQFWLTLSVYVLSLGWILGERYIFFVSAVAPRMPGGVAP